MTAKQRNESVLVSLSHKKPEAQKPTSLFPFTDKEERWIRKAMFVSKRFMARFGQTPQQPQINEPRNLTPQSICHQEENTK